MKKLIIMFVALLFMSASVFADGLTATLQQGDNMMPFYGADAFMQAYEAAKDGAVITLSSGQFNDVATVSKQISIIGAYAFNNTESERTILKSIIVNANNVKIEGIYFSGILSIGEIENFHIKRSWIRNLRSTNSHTNTLVDQCVVESDKAIANGINYQIRNSTIESFHAMNTPENIAHIENCVIWKYNYNNMYDEHITQPYAVYLHNVLCGFLCINFLYHHVTMSFSAPNEFYYNLFLNTTDFESTDYGFSASFDYTCANEGNITGKNFKYYYNTKDRFSYPASDMKEGCIVLGIDDKPIGIKGGGGFSEYPAIPRIICKTIDKKTNEEGKINVNIKVKAEQ